ncbi:MAG TPA: hypothetical protein VEJ38_00870 [Candidatus Acidoferrales bacterium]|nr:hypothetical protein [Candidatus Acidoferrales bacterium]
MASSSAPTNARCSLPAMIWRVVRVVVINFLVFAVLAEVVSIILGIAEASRRAARAIT